MIKLIKKFNFVINKSYLNAIENFKNTQGI